MKKFFLIFLAPSLLISTRFLQSYTLFNAFQDGIFNNLLKAWSSLPILPSYPLQTKYMVYGFEYAISNHSTSILVTSLSWFAFGMMFILPATLVLPLLGITALKLSELSVKSWNFYVGKKIEIKIRYHADDVSLGGAIKNSLLSPSLNFNDYIRLVLFSIPLIFIISIFAEVKTQNLPSSIFIIFFLTTITPIVSGVTYLFQCIKIKFRKGELLSEQYFSTITKIVTASFLLSFLFDLIVKPINFIPDFGIAVYFESLGSIFILYIFTSLSSWGFNKIYHMDKRITRIYFIIAILIPFHYYAFFSLMWYQGLWASWFLQLFALIFAFLRIVFPFVRNSKTLLLGRGESNNPDIF